ncbi:hypothetical protein SLJ52_003504 [Pseudomonas aeruginosa]|uniref:hypothetical protein n=1 Tax=Pseudomonas aeruginosa TaxID=287 RepID=UPI0010674CD5|nr:hypothetical protein [Pseudomonas aeruginosa]EKQ5877260.1 hypothetical protein [Pseudomonas aeruginosa]ELC8327449.1 hypothetical protein [Pseudomonas aeruginosa]ELX9492992.1 hypothetical protein [Pseudomonas aeruginosa]MBG4629076.1 hypothetical protein [Pseudomonas aeruginosa]MBG6338819.1 hypothetical protein [Pseudomonas aeruginosa]
MAWTFDPDATYDLYRVADDGERDPFPYYRIVERRFYNAIDRLPDGSYRGIAGAVVLRQGPQYPVLIGEHPEPIQLGVLEAAVFNRGDGERFVLVEVK